MPSVCMIQIMRANYEATGKICFWQFFKYKIYGNYQSRENPDLQLAIDIAQENGEVKVKNTTFWRHGSVEAQRNF